MSLLTETADYNTPGSWAPASNGWPEIHGDDAYDMYVFCTQTGILPYGSYVLMSQRGHYGATGSCLRVHTKYLSELRENYELAGRPNSDESLKRRIDSGKPCAPKWCDINTKISKPIRVELIEKMTWARAPGRRGEQELTAIFMDSLTFALFRQEIGPPYDYSEAKFEGVPIYIVHMPYREYGPEKFLEVL